MPTLVHDQSVRGTQGLRSQDATNYTNAQSQASADITFPASGIAIGYKWDLSFDYQYHCCCARLDLRKYKGQKVTSVDFKTRASSVSKSTGGTFTCELRGHTRTNRTGVYVNADQYTPTDLTNATLYATCSVTDGVAAYITWTLSGSTLLDAINAAIDGDGILDFILCTQSQRTGTPPSGTNVETVTFIGAGSSFLSSPFDDPMHCELTIAAEQEHYFVETHLQDYFRTYCLSTSWANVLAGTGTRLYDSSPDSQDSAIIALNGTGNYESHQLLMRFDLSALDTTKQISKIYFRLLMNGGASGPTAEPWHIRRYDWTTASSTHYRSQSQLNLLTKVAEFVTSDILAAGGFPQDDSGDEDICHETLILADQAMIDEISDAPTLAGFVIHSERLITGTAPTALSDDAITGPFIARDRALECASGLLIEYDDGSSFFGGLF